MCLLHIFMNWRGVVSDGFLKTLYILVLLSFLFFNPKDFIWATSVILLAFG